MLLNAHKNWFFLKQLKTFCASCCLVRQEVKTFCDDKQFYRINFSFIVINISYVFENVSLAINIYIG